MRTANGLWNREKFLHRPLAVFISQQDSLAQTDSPFNHHINHI